MANPTVTARQVPAGIMLKDGFKTEIALANDPTIRFWEKSVQPPGVDGGEPIDIVTMFNHSYRTAHPRKLKTITPMTARVAYDPKVLQNIVGQVNVRQAITLHFSDYTTWAFWGFLKSFVPSDHSEGNFPEATVTIVPTNVDPSDDSEFGPVYGAAVGTTGEA